MAKRLNAVQVAVLKRLARGGPFDDVSNPARLSARALSHRGIVNVTGRGPTWKGVLTDLGKFYLEHGAFPTPPAPVATPTLPTIKKPPKPKVPDEWEVDSPRGKRKSGRRPQGDPLFTSLAPDPWDEKILVSVKEAAWMLSLPEGAIRRAVRDSDLDRVFIGGGRANYRVVYGSLLAWVNSMPTQPAHRSWWR